MQARFKAFASLKALVVLALVCAFSFASPTAPSRAAPFPPPGCSGNTVVSGQQCVACPSGQYADLQHKACHSCAPGATPIKTGGGCTAPFPPKQCMGNTINNPKMSSQCVACPTGSKADAAHKQCSAADHCFGNTILNPSVAGQCKMCPTGQHADYTHMQCFTDKP
jgi:hypothetical protein